MSSYLSGLNAERNAADMLRSKGFHIIDRNWKTRWCEIDIVAKKDNCIHFIEVKYRNKSNWGSAIEYITPQKLKRMQRGALMWIKRFRWQGAYRLSVVATDGLNSRFETVEI